MNGINKLRIGIFIPVRLSSKRYPGKALTETYFGKPLEILIKNLSKSYIKKKDIVICTTRDKCDIKLKSFVKKNNCKIFAGSKSNIIDRFYKANLKFKYDYIVEVDGDDIMTDFYYINICLKEILRSKSDFVYTVNLPIGMNCKVFSSQALEKTHFVNQSKNNANGFMYLFYKNPLLKKKKLLFNKYKKAKIRLTLDYVEDIKFFETILFLLNKNNQQNSLKNYLKIIKKNKDIVKINFFRNFDYYNNTEKMKSLKIKVDNKIKRIPIS